MAEEQSQEQPQIKLTELSLDAHADLKIDPSCAIKVAEQQHLINLKVSEVGMAVSSFPVLLSKISEKSEWAISAINSFELNTNLFVENNEWTGTHLPIGMQTYPFFLMEKGADEKGKNYTIGIDENSPAFSKGSGEPLFEDGKASIRLSQATAQLEVEIKNDIHTYQFAKKLDELGLIKEMDLQVQYQENRVNTLKGLHTIDEAKLMELSSEQFDELRQAGYLAPIYAMLISIYQFNNLILRHNKQNANKVAQVKLEAPKEANAA